MRASFDTEQPKVNIVEDNDNVYIFLCLNGEWVNRNYDEQLPSVSCWECDYIEIITKSDRIDLDDVRVNPEKYIDWVEPAKKTDSEKIAELQEQNRMLTQCLMEMSEIVYA